MPDRIFEIRCPVHGFVPINEWERDIISQPAFQRLRRIRQLAWTEEVYPGAMHTRFEHSLGVMHTASLLYDAICRNGREVLEDELQYNDAGLQRYRQFVRLAVWTRKCLGSTSYIPLLRNCKVPNPAELF